MQGETYNLTTVQRHFSALQHPAQAAFSTLIAKPSTMKLLPDAIQGPSITGYGPGWVSVNGEKFTRPLLIHSATGVRPWDCDGFDDLGESHFARLLEFQPELVLFGSGERIRFARPQWLQALYAQRIGVETMDTQAACRTYNFLVGEGRQVVAALLL